MKPVAKFIIVILVFFVCAFLQSSVLSYFAISGYFPNVIFILFFVLTFFSESNSFFMKIISLVAGFFSDMLLPSHFGISMLIFLAIYLLHNQALRFLKEGKDRRPFFYFAPMFCAAYLFYTIALSIFSSALNIGIFLMADFYIGLFYNLLLASSVFYAYKKIGGFRPAENQLKLF